MKKILTLLLTTLMLFSLCACAKTKEEPKPVENSAFLANLKEKADLRWNICTEADTTVAEEAGDYVFFLMYKHEDIDTEDYNLGEKLSGLFKENQDKLTTEELGQLLLAASTEDIAFVGMEVEEGDLAGFTEPITGFEEGYMFSPMIGSIPFVAYVFKVAK